ncbi:MAG: nicotinate (nicotinamide) nucleotide adenylyltransferase [Ruminococcaceae bacterium]|nr:nicotinate (nicotinamide) nucleotide adenylyltransferase [Oscillospiraceae bacterium]
MNGMDMLRVGVYGGTFAPIHNAHVAVAKAFMEQMKLDYLFVIPTFIPPHKEVDRSDDPLYRLKMCELAFEGTDGVIISDVEIKRGGRSYTYDTLKELQRPDTRLFLLCGTDMVLTFDKWYRYEDILKMCYPTYVRREDDPLLTARIISKIGEYYEKHGVMFRRIVTEPMPMASTDIRRAVREGKDISELVPPAVEKFIRENRLYLD